MSAAWQPEMDHLRRRVEALEKMLCQGHPAGVACGVCRPEPVPECCTDYQPRDTVTASKAFFAGWEAYPDHHRDTPEPTSDMLYDAWCIIANAPVAGWAFSGTPEPGDKEWIDAAKRWRDAFLDLNSAPEPDPEPEWREWVTAQHDEVVGSRASALEDVLMCLSEVERGASKNYALAHIVARCEREVGDGWQADPSGWVATPALHALLRCVAGVPTGPGTAWPETDWQGLANAASAWLRDLTDLTEEQS